MNAERFQRASAIFLEARRCTDAERHVFLESRCGEDRDLLAAVEDLLRGDSTRDVDLHTQAVGSAIGQAAAEVFAAHPREAASDSGLGNGERRIGRYRLIRKIGEGGMGAVYEAQQDNPSRVVALKIIRPGLVSPATLRRFQHEVQVLGRLQHPGIAQIYEAGMDDSGEGAQPFFAMEYVNGLPLNIFAQNHKLGTRPRMELMAKICDAVEHAHQKGVIHRDLKPGNILVVDALAPKILDFGVARAIDSDLHTTTLRTDIGQLIGTISYMSPEQAAADPNELDTRSDVYALGVICYELLSGRLPYDLNKRPIPEAMRIIGQDDPTPLSVINRVFRGDVETIIGKALEKEKIRRYQSAAELASDIRRYLRDEPIVARPASAMYQLGKFARRNKILVGGVAAVFVALVLGIIGTGIGLVQSQEEARKARKMNEYLKGIIGWFHPSDARGQEVALRDVLNEAARRIGAELGDEPEVAAALHDTIGYGFVTIRDFESAETHLVKALELRRRLDGDSSLPVAETLDHLAQNHLQQAEFDQAQATLEQVLEIRRRHLGENHVEVAEVFSRLGDVKSFQHDAQGAEQNLREALKRRKLALGHDDINSAADLNKLGEVFLAAQRFDEAEAVLNESLALRRSLGRGDDLDCAGILNQLAQLAIQHKRDSVAAESLFGESLDILTRHLGENHAQIAATLGSLALLVDMRGDKEEAMRLYQRVVDIGRATAQAEDPAYVGSLTRLGVGLAQLGRHAEAEGVLREAIELRRSVAPNGRAAIARLEGLLGSCVMHEARYDEAELLLVHALEELTAVQGANDAQAIEAREHLAKMYDAWGKAESAARIRTQPLSVTPPAREGES